MRGVQQNAKTVLTQSLFLDMGERLRLILTISTQCRELS